MPFIKTEDCVGCRMCLQECPVEAISMVDNKAIIDQEKCVKCGRCMEVCPRDAIHPNSENPQLRSFGGKGMGRQQSRGLGRGGHR